MARGALITFAKPPVRGTVKTRLESALGADGALRLHEALLHDALARQARLASAADGVLFLASPPPAPPPAAYELQRGDDLGERMAHAFESLFARGYRAVVLVGIDSPTVPDAEIARALRLLRGEAAAGEIPPSGTADVVLGPCDDGGYYLIGLAAPRPELFRGIAWGGERVFADTHARAAALGLRVARLAPAFDVDRPADLERLRAAIEALAPQARPVRTAALLAELVAC